MKKLLLILLFLPMIGFSQSSLFTNDNSNSIVATKDPSRTMGLELNTAIYDNILSESPDFLQLDLPFFNQNISLGLESFEAYSSEIEVFSKDADGDVNLNLSPTILSYKIIFNGNSIGIMNFFNGQINATFKFDNQQFEIANYLGSYILFEASNSINSSNFSCAVESQFNNTNNSQYSEASSTPVCVEVAVEIDYYTRQTFNSDTEAVNWAIAIFAGVSQLYEAQTNASVVVLNTWIWNHTDPYAAFVNDAGAMLESLTDYWVANRAGVSRDLVHLLTKRTNTGTGGIAWLMSSGVAACNNSFGYGFSANMNNDTTYNFPNPSYTWNLVVVTHEIGHNLGANHTFWCGWNADPAYNFSGGAITNCVDVDGTCPNNPSPQVGTIMSYCHVVSGGSVILEFHPIILSQAINPGIANASCVTACGTPSWDCVGGACVDPGTGNGQYSSLSSCQAACAPPPPPGPCVNVGIGVGGGAYDYEISWELIDISSGTIIASAQAPNGAGTFISCISGCFEMRMYDTYGDGWNGASWGIFNSSTSVLLADGTLNSGFSGTSTSFCIIPGCTDLTACNYDATATVDDGSCILPDGCTDSLACNYDPQATCDDGSCILPDGCVDSLACNYDPQATCDDGSCYYSISSSITQSGEVLYAVTTPSGLDANWYNIQQQDGVARIWLMKKDAISFVPTFECSYFIVVEDDNGCIDTSNFYYYGANATKIGAVSISPNPASGIININFENPKNQFVKFELITNNGAKLDEFITLDNNLSIDLSKYSSGVYYLYFNGEDISQGCRLEMEQKKSIKIILNK